MRLEGAARSRAHFEYARKYAERGDARSTKKAIAHFGRGMAYGAVYRDKRLSNAGPYTYHWKLYDDKIRYATIDVTAREGGASVAKIQVELTDKTDTFNVHLVSPVECDLTRRYIAREVASVIRYAHKDEAKMARMMLALQLIMHQP